MLYWLFYQFRDIWIGFNVLRYISFRALMSALTGFLVAWYLIGIGKEYLLRLQAYQPTRDGKECPQLSQWHESKRSTPTMGGVFILISLLLVWVLWVDWRVIFPWLGTYVLLHLGLLGLVDDLRKLRTNSAKGVSKRAKLINQAVTGLVVGLVLVGQDWFPKEVFFPFFKQLVISLGVFYPLWSALVITATSNAVNLTDGMDGLAIGTTIMVALTYAGLAYVAGHYRLATYLFVPYVRGAGEVAVMCAGLFGVGLGYLWYNAYPAEVFMGDVGALAIGGLIGAVALFVKQEVLLVLAGGIFVAEALSVILQVGGYRLFRKRPFKLAPIHHHFQVGGQHEVKVIIRFWIVSILLAILSLASLKLR